MIIIFHLVCALLAFAIGTFILFLKKGTYKHRILGRIWVTLMIFVSFSAIFIQEINPGHYSLIHLLIPLTVFLVIFGIYFIRKFKKTGQAKYLHLHQFCMVPTFYLALVVAGIFALLMPGRLLHQLFFG